jgi:hypothetical protein
MIKAMKEYLLLKILLIVLGYAEGTDEEHLEEIKQ